MHEDYIQHDPLVARGLIGFQHFFTEWFNAIPDWNYAVSKLVAEADTV